MTAQPPLAPRAAVEGVTVNIDPDTRTAHIYVPRRTRATTDEDFARMIEQMTLARREWGRRGYRVKFVR
jgi:hypothetical protein